MSVDLTQTLIPERHESQCQKIVAIALIFNPSMCFYVWSKYVGGLNQVKNPAPLFQKCVPSNLERVFETRNVWHTYLTPTSKKRLAWPCSVILYLAVNRRSTFGSTKSSSCAKTRKIRPMTVGPSVGHNSNRCKIVLVLRMLLSDRVAPTDFYGLISSFLSDDMNSKCAIFLAFHDFLRVSCRNNCHL